VRSSTDIDHMDPDTILADGKKRKQACISQCPTRVQMLAELERNTDEDGTVLMQGLCRECHALKTAADHPPLKPTEARVWVNALKRQLASCAYPTCPMPEDKCTAGRETLFHFDHLHPQACRCAVCTADPSLRKVASVSSLVTHRRPLEEVQRECQPTKVRLLHGSCHLRHTAEQYCSGMWASALKSDESEAAQSACTAVMQADADAILEEAEEEAEAELASDEEAASAPCTPPRAAAAAAAAAPASAPARVGERHKLPPTAARRKLTFLLQSIAATRPISANPPDLTGLSGQARFFPPPSIPHAAAAAAATATPAAASEGQQAVNDMCAHLLAIKHRLLTAEEGRFLVMHASQPPPSPTTEDCLERLS